MDGLFTTIGYKAFGESLDDVSLRLNQGMNYEHNVCPRDDISVVKCGLHIQSEARNYADFVLQMKRSEEAFREKMNMK